MLKDSPAIEAIPVRDRLLNAAEQVVARDGVVNLTLEAVAREAGVSKGGLLYHFPSKSSLINATVERLAKRCQARQDDVIASEPSAPGGFTRAYLKARTRPLEPHEVPFHCALLAAAGTDPQYLDPFRNRICQWQKLLESDGIDPATATIVRLAVDGIALGRLLGLPMPQSPLFEEVLEKLTKLTYLPESDKDRP